MLKNRLDEQSKVTFLRERIDADKVMFKDDIDLMMRIMFDWLRADLSDVKTRKITRLSKNEIKEIKQFLFDIVEGYKELDEDFGKIHRLMQAAGLNN